MTVRMYNGDKYADVHESAVENAKKNGFYVVDEPKESKPVEIHEEEAPEEVPVMETKPVKKGKKPSRD